MKRRRTTEAQDGALETFLGDIWRWTGAVVRLEDLIIETQEDDSIRAVWATADRLAYGHFDTDGGGSSGWGKVEMVHHTALDPCRCPDCAREKAAQTANL